MTAEFGVDCATDLRNKKNIMQTYVKYIDIWKHIRKYENIEIDRKHRKYEIVESIENIYPMRRRAANPPPRVPGGVVYILNFTCIYIYTSYVYIYMYFFLLEDGGCSFICASARG